MRKTYRQLLALASAGVLLLGGANARATMEISASVRINAVADFDAPLAAEGTWVTIGAYGRCWHPRGVAVGWRPYCEGEWVWTDNGWYWQSDEAWAWACYHYGTWVIDPGYGWVWVPGVEWAPAWVVWRTGGGYTGWAPCAPRGVTITADWFGFVATAHMGERVHPTTLTFKSATIFRETKSVGPMAHEMRDIGGHSTSVYVNHGPGVTDFQKAAGHEVKSLPVQEVHGRTHYPDSMMHGAPGAHPAPAVNGGEHNGQPGAPHQGEPPHSGEGHNGGKENKHDQ